MIGGSLPAFIMPPSVPKVLEFERVVHAVAAFALTPMGEARVQALEPQSDRDAVSTLLRGTSETRRYLADHALFPLRASTDLPEILHALAVQGAPLGPQQL